MKTTHPLYWLREPRPDPDKEKWHPKYVAESAKVEDEETA